MSRESVPRQAAWLPRAALLSAMVVACSGAVEPSPTPVPPTAAPAGVRVVIASSDPAVGSNRFVFGILDVTSRPVRVPEARATFMYIDVTPLEVRAQAVARFVKWPTGGAGVYVVDDIPFDQPGRWGLVVQVTTEDGTDLVGQAGFVVNALSSSPAIGAAAPRSVNRTAADVADLAELTSAPGPDAELYQISIADAIASDRPTVITFATPAFCQTATCGPQVQVISAIKDRHEGQASFIHVEVYENPDEMRGDLSKGRLSPLMAEWGLQTEPFTFVLDSDGLVSTKFEGFVTVEELEAALEGVLGP